MLNVIMCPFTCSLIECYFIIMVATIFGILYGHPNNFDLQIRASSNLFSRYAPSWMFLSKDIFFEYWIEHVTFGLLYIMFEFSIIIFYSGVPGFATDCPCVVWCRGLTTCLLYVGPPLEI